MENEKLSHDDIIAIIRDELSIANTSMPDAVSNSLKYYLGLPLGTEVEGRSTLISTDVADAIEWIMPQIMKEFTQANEIVVFDPTGRGDELQAELESEFVYDILMKKNNGFVLIHEFVKDALLHQNGILKVYYEDYKESKIEPYTGIIDVQLEMLLAQENVELLEKTTEQVIDSETGQLINIHDVKVKVTERTGKICIDSIPPEQFIVNSQHNSIDLSSARFTGHVVIKSASDLIKEGYSKEIVNELPFTDGIKTDQRFTLQNESVTLSNSYQNDASSKLIDIGEYYLELDVDGDGIAQLMQITTGGNSGLPTKILKKEELNYVPWIACTAILMSHKFRGLSIYDRLKEIQDNKTYLIRNVMDNIYYQNNQRLKVLKGGAVELDDLLVARPGGIIRMNRLDAVEPLETAPVGEIGFTMMRYLDEIRAGRVGVSAEGPATPQNIGDRVGSEGVERIMNAKEELVGLIVRVICETGIKPLMLKIRDLAVRHFDTVQEFKFKGEWVKVHPTTWPPRTQCSVRVGTGTGNKTKQLMALSQVLMLQEKIIAMPGQALCNQEKVFSAINDFCKFSGLNSADKYFIDPVSQEGQQMAQQAQQAQMQAQEEQKRATLAQLQAEAKIAESALIASQAQQQNVILKGQVEKAKNARELLEQSYIIKTETLKNELEQLKALIDQQSKADATILKDKEIEASLRKAKMDNETRIIVANIQANKKDETKDNESTED